MGFGGISAWQLVILLLIIILIFGTRRLRNMGGDLGAAVKGFKKGLNEGEDPEPTDPEQLSDEEHTIAKTEEAGESTEKA
jgi:sec-independent protein translocase protein TatA